METSSLKKSVEEWIVELNDPQAEHRRDALTALTGSVSLDDRIVDELKLMARGDPDAKTQSLAKKLLKSRGINILPQVPFQSGVKQSKLLLSWEFWVGFFLYPILNFYSYSTFFAPSNTFSLCLAVNIVWLIFFWFIRKNIALGMLASFVLIVGFVILFLFYLSRTCFPDGCPAPQ